MKKLIVAAFAVTCAVSVFAQGTVNFNNVTALGTTHVWGPSTSEPSLSLIGPGSNDTLPAGTTPYATSGMSMIGVSLTGKYGAQTTFAQLLAANGSGQAESSLTPQGATTTFRSGSGAGRITGITATLAGITPDAAFATFEMVAWDNSSGNYATWALAEAAWKAGTIAAGKSGAFTVAAIGGAANSPPNMYIPSFNLYMVPEPSTFALAGLGLAALVAFRRRS